MGIRLSEDEAWDVIGASHTGILTTLRRDGSPVTLPVWFAVLDRVICMRTPRRTKKVARIRRDPRGSFLVESGERWAELLAVHLSGTVAVVGEEDRRTRISTALDEKYAAFRTAASAMTEQTRDAYADFAFLELTPTPGARILTWDNARITVAGDT
jgi:PPOX class probable F420-dependent enzyme